MRAELLGKSVEILSGFPFKSELFNTDGEGLPLIRVRDVNSGFAGMYYSGKYPAEYVVQNGDILVGMDGDFRAIEWKNGPALLNQRVCKIIPDENRVKKQYLLQFLPKALDEIHRKTTYTTVKHLSSKTIAEIPIPLPPLPEQIRIADMLSRAEKLLAQRKESLALLDELVKSRFVEMFGDPVRNEKGWEVKKLGSDIEHLTSGERGWSKYQSETGVRFVRSFDVKENLLSFDDAAFLELPQRINKERTRIRSGDVLLTITGSRIGRVAPVPDNIDEAYVSQHVAIIRVKSFHPVYLSYFLSHPKGGQLSIRKLQYGQTKPGLNLDQIRSFAVLSPPLRLQNAFAAFVEKTEALKRRYQQSLGELTNLYGSLSQRAFGGELFKGNETGVSEKKQGTLFTIPNESPYDTWGLNSMDMHSGILALIIAEHAKDAKHKNTLGRTKGEKIVHIVEAHADLDLGRIPKKMAAGPADFKHLLEVEKYANEQKWFSTESRNLSSTGYRYIKGKAFSEICEKVQSVLADKLKEVKKIVDLFIPMDTGYAEIITTTYAAWNNLLIAGKSPTPQEILFEARENWAQEKLALDAADFRKAISWLKVNNLMPRGKGKKVS